MTKTVYAILSFFLLLVITLSLSVKTYAQEKHVTFSYLSFFKQAVLTVKKITPTPEKILGIAIQPTVIPTILPTAQPTAIPVVQQTGVSDYLLTGVNAYRATYGLPAVKSTPQTCAFATIRASEISEKFSHDGFNNRVSNHIIPYDSWAHATENIAEAADYKEVVTLWANSPEHAANMRDNTPYVCVVQSGNFYAYEGMRP